MLEGRTLAILGCGAVGRALAQALAGAGARLVLWNRTATRAEELARSLGAPARAAGDLADATEGVEALLLAVSEDALTPIAEHLAERLEPPAEGREGGPEASGPRVALHTAGVRGSAVLAPLSAAGLAVGKMHPLATVGGAAEEEEGSEAERLRATWWGLAGDGPAVDLATELVHGIGAHVLPVQDGEEAARRYHAAANLAAGGVVALLDLALEAAEGACDATQLRVALAGLASGALSSLVHDDPADVLVGPQARGAVEVVSSHLDVLARDAPVVLPVYRELSRRMVALARERGEVDTARLDELERLLEDS